MLRMVIVAVVGQGNSIDNAAAHAAGNVSATV
jgi:hypothetical protein